jgi:hypothetical protein
MRQAGLFRDIAEATRGRTQGDREGDNITVDVGDAVETAFRPSNRAIKNWNKAVQGQTVFMRAESREAVKRFRAAQTRHQEALKNQQLAIEAEKKGAKIANYRRRVEEALVESTEEMREAQQAYINAQNPATNKMAMLAGRAGTAALALGSIAAVGAKYLAGQTVQQLAAGSQLAVGEMEMLTAAVGVTTEEFLELEGANRQALNAMGGTSVAMQGFRNQIAAGIFEADGLARTFGSVRKGFIGVVQATGDMAKSGMRSTAATQGYIQQMDEFRTIFGTTPEQFRQLNNTLMENVEVRQSLRGLDQNERRVRMEGIRMQIELNGALGMTSEQAVAAATRLQEIAGGTAKNRLQQAARFQAMAAAYGIEGGAEAAAAIRAGRRATPEQQRIIQQVANQLSDIGARTETGGTIGQEMMFQQMSDSLGLTELVGKNSVFNSTLGETNRALEGTDDAVKQLNALLGPGSEFTTLNNNTDKLSETMGGLAIAVERLSDAIDSKLGQLLKQVGSTALGAFTGGAAAAKFGPSVLRALGLGRFAGPGLAAAAPAMIGPGVAATGAAAAGTAAQGAAGAAGAGAQAAAAGSRAGGAMRLLGGAGRLGGAVLSKAFLPLTLAMGAYGVIKDFDKLEGPMDYIKAIGSGMSGGLYTPEYSTDAPTPEQMAAGDITEEQQMFFPVIAEQALNQTTLAEAALEVSREQKALLEQLVALQGSLLDHVTAPKATPGPGVERRALPGSEMF